MSTQESRWSEDTIELEGGIVSNTGGQSVSVTNTSLQDGKLTVTVDTDSGESVVTQVITTYSYNLTIDNSAEIETVEIKHTDGETYVYQEQNY